MKASQAPKVDGEDGAQTNGVDPVPTPPEKRKKIVVVGLGMVGVAFMFDASKTHAESPSANAPR